MYFILGSSKVDTVSLLVTFFGNPKTYLGSFVWTSSWEIWKIKWKTDSSMSVWLVRVGLHVNGLLIMRICCWFAWRRAFNGFHQSSGLINCHAFLTVQQSCSSCCIAENFLPVKWKSLALVASFISLMAAMIVLQSLVLRGESVWWYWYPVLPYCCFLCTFYSSYFCILQVVFFWYCCNYIYEFICCLFS